jgi:hypothetical protein
MPEQELDFVELPFQNFYTNAVKISSSPFDVALIVMERIDTKNATVKARIVMTPLHAKLLAEALADHVQQWEAKHGEIQIPLRRDDAATSASEPEPQP